MKNILIRNLDEKVVEQLKRRADRRGRSLQAELRLVLEAAAEADGAREKLIRSAEAVRNEILHRRGGKLMPDSSKSIRRDRDRR